MRLLQDMKPPSLRLEKNYSDQAYPCQLIIDMGFDPSNNKCDKLYRHNPYYREFKSVSSIPAKMRGIDITLVKNGLDDFCIFRSGEKICLHFRDGTDRAIAVAGLAPHMAYSTSYVHCDNLPVDKMNIIAGHLRKVFEDTASGGRVEFKVDDETQIITARTENGHDFIQFLKDSRMLKKKQQLLGL